jgi:hypothetical protein
VLVWLFGVLVTQYANYLEIYTFVCSVTDNFGQRMLGTSHHPHHLSCLTSTQPIPKRVLRTARLLPSLSSFSKFVSLSGSSLCLFVIFSSVMSFNNVF